ncbi:MAG: hypothetical protein AB1761_09100 [Pseudomonadota bacterium]
MNRIKLLIGAAAAALALAACGGGGGDGLTELQREDRAASASVAGLIAFANGMIAMLTGETGEPRTIDGIALPTTDTDEPVAL